MLIAPLPPPPLPHSLVPAIAIAPPQSRGIAVPPPSATNANAAAAPSPMPPPGQQRMVYGGTSSEPSSFEHPPHCPLPPPPSSPADITSDRGGGGQWSAGYGQIEGRGIPPSSSALSSPTPAPASIDLADAATPRIAYHAPQESLPKNLSEQQYLQHQQRLLSQGQEEEVNSCSNPRRRQWRRSASMPAVSEYVLNGEDCPPRLWSEPMMTTDTLTPPEDDPHHPFFQLQWHQQQMLGDLKLESGAKVPQDPLSPQLSSRDSNMPPPKRSDHHQQGQQQPPTDIQNPQVFMTNLQHIMTRSQRTMQSLQEYDRANGLPRSHSSTMVKTSRSRRQLQDGIILKKWDGSPLIKFEQVGNGRVVARLGPKVRRMSGFGRNSERGGGGEPKRSTTKMKRRVSC